MNKFFNCIQLNDYTTQHIIMYVNLYVNSIGFSKLILIKSIQSFGKLLFINTKRFISIFIFTNRKNHFQK